MFFDPISFAEQKVTLDHLREWSNSIAASYLNAGVSPTTSLTKIAQSEELTPDQIKDLAGRANQVIHQHKYAAAKEKYAAADFPHADARTAIASLQTGGATKLAYSMPAPICDDGGFDTYAMWGIKPDNTDQLIKKASLKHEMKAAHLKLANMKSKTDDQEFLTKVAADAAEAKFVKLARQYALSDSSSADRMKTLGGISHFAKCAGLDARRPLAKLAYVLGGEGKLTPAHTKLALQYFLSKEADCKAPQELISEWLPARVVNGEHPLYITLKTFHDHQARMADHRGRSSLVDDRLQILSQRIRAL